MKKIISLCVFMLLLVNCAPSEKAIQEAISKTQTAMPTPTILPFEQLFLDDILIKENDLPAGLSGAQISNEEACDSSNGDICADYYISQELSFDNEKRGNVEIWVYENEAYNELRFQNRKENYIAECKKAAGQCYPNDPHEVDDLGDKTTMIDAYNYIGYDHFYITYSRCNATIEIDWWSVSAKPETIITYAKRLDNRIKEFVCR